MLKVIVADDMEMIREGIKAMLEQLPSGAGALEIRTASSGAEAVRLMERIPADLLITDIRMPDMDGIALMERCRRLWPQTSVIVVSGYDEFKYAQKAIEYGARAYLLKPIDKAELFRAVEKVRADKLLDTGRTDSRARTEKSRRALFFHYIQGGGENTELCQLMTGRYPFLTGSCDLLLIGFPGGEAEAETLRRRLTARIPENALLLGSAKELVLAAAAGCDIEAMLYSIADLKFTSALVRGVRGTGGLREAYRQACDIFVHRLLYPGKRLLTAEDISKMSTDFTIPHAEVERLGDMVGIGAESELSRALTGLFERKKLAGYGIGYTLALCDTLYRVLRKIEKKLHTGAELEPIHMPLEFETMREYLLFANDQLLRLHRAARDQGSGRDNLAIDRAEAYIRANYMRPITLAVVSNEVSLNYAYFSNSFKKQTGRTFSEYLRDIRLDAAKKLLRQPDIRISEVAERVGYDSYKSFYRAFKESSGMTPAEYQQKQYRRQD